jgi:aminoglycoside phosphotransferase (APT) family kinase protein
MAPHRVLFAGDLTTQLPPLVDEAALEKYLDEHLPGDGELVVERHQAGHSNETFFLRRGADGWVLRRPPRGAFLPTAHDVGREYRVLTALADTPARVPRTLLMCEDESVIGAPFYLMERVHGDVIRNELPGIFTEKHREGLGTELIDALVELHAIDPQALDLEGFGKPTGYLERQLRRWQGQMELTLPLTRPLPELERVGEWLRENLPTSPPTTLVHGDYKLDNVMFKASPPPRLIAILDWEMSTLGDPLADLGYMISFWREPGDERDEIFGDLRGVTEMPGFQTRAELIDRYASQSRRDVDDLDWYVVLAIWKLAVLLEGSYARHLGGMTDDPFFALMKEGVPYLAHRALSIAH